MSRIRIKTYNLNKNQTKHDQQWCKHTQHWPSSHKPSHLWGTLAAHSDGSSNRSGRPAFCCCTAGPEMAQWEGRCGVGPPTGLKYSWVMCAIVWVKPGLCHVCKESSGAQATDSCSRQMYNLSFHRKVYFFLYEIWSAGWFLNCCMQTSCAVSSVSSSDNWCSFFVPAVV